MSTQRKVPLSGSENGTRPTFGQGLFRRVGDAQRHQIVLARRNLQGFRKIGGHKVRQQKGRAPLLDRVAEKPQRHGHVRFAALRFKLQQIADDAQNMLLALPRRDEFLHRVRKEDGADLVVVVQRRKTDHRRNLRNQSRA